MREALEYSRRGLVTHRVGEGREPGKVDKHDRDAQPSRYVRLLAHPCELLEVHHGVLGERTPPCLPVEIPHGRLDERDEPIGRGCAPDGNEARRAAALDGLMAAQLLGPSRLVDVEVKEAVLGLRHLPERVDVDPEELRQHLFGEARLERDLHPGECLDVLVGEQLSPISELGGLHQLSQGVDSHAEPARCLLE
jgi:hypothetical protein